MFGVATPWLRETHDKTGAAEGTLGASTAFSSSGWGGGGISSAGARRLRTLLREDAWGVIGDARATGVSTAAGTAGMAAAAVWAER